MRRLLPINGLGIALLLSASLSAATPEGESKPGEGVVCFWAMTSTAAEIGKRCPGKGDPAFQGSLDQSIALLDEYVSTNGHVGDDYIAKFKRQQGGVGLRKALLCRSDILSVYDVLHSRGGPAVLEATRELVAQAGPPAWGDCL
jgi:hypothetical protein